MYQPYLRFDETLWYDLTRRMADAGFNMVIIDLGDGVRYESHPEIAVEGAWSPQKLRDELSRLRELGLEPIPKLNFSAYHDTWLGEYGRMLSTSIYYRVCQELIDEVADLFDKPRFFHLGMDEETFSLQRYLSMAIVRQHELWWHDLKFYVEHVEKHGIDACIWSDSCWHHPEEFAREMPRSVLQSNWYYGEQFDFPEEKVVNLDEPILRTSLEAFGLLEELRMSQLPAGSNFFNNINFEALVSFCCKNIPPERLQGFLMTPWHPTLEESRAHHMAAIEQVERARHALAGACYKSEPSL